MVTFVEQQVERAVDCWKTNGELGCGRDVEQPFRFGKHLFRSRYPLLDCGVAVDECVSHFVYAEAAEHIEHQCNLCFLG
jgi:hypothetical protein